MKRLRIAKLSAAVFALVLSSNELIARADDTPAMTAQSLFDLGKELMKEKRFAEACRALGESQRLDPGGGTLFALAYCHEQSGHISVALSEFKEALSMAQRDGRADREKLARDHIVALEV